jgi:S-formylglutathione hydrolase
MCCNQTNGTPFCEPENFFSLFNFRARMQSVDHSSFKVVSSVRVFDGTLQKCSFTSAVLGNTTATFNVFVPSGASSSSRCPVLVWVSGLTCNEDNFAFKSGAFRALAQHGLACVMPDTSPRGVTVAGDSDDWAFGVAASYYVDATRAPFAANYQMFSFVSRELPELLRHTFADRLDMDRVGISGHSVGGHGAVMLGLRRPDLFKSMSAFAPMLSPSRVPWGIKAFTNYLGSVESGADYDSELLARKYSGPEREILIDQGTDDKFLAAQLDAALFLEACKENGKIRVDYRRHEGYDHGYYFVSTYIDDHIAFHAKRLK